MTCKTCLNYFGGRTWKYLLGFLLPIILLPLPLLDSSRQARCGYVILLMAGYWTLEPIPLAATSLLPIVLFPLLGVISTSDACTPYMNSTNMMFVGGLMMAVAIESCNLHKRIALNVLHRIQPTAAWIMLGFMGIAMFLSMWISNTATAALMVPIIDAVLSELEAKSGQDDMELTEIAVISKRMSNGSMGNHHPIRNGNIYPSIEHVSKEKDDEPPLPTENSSKRNSKVGGDVKVSGDALLLRKAMLLSIAYSTNVGGTGTLTGTGPNLVLKNIVDDMFPDSRDITFDKWMIYNVPVMFLCVIISWIYLQIVYVRRAATKYSKEMRHTFKDIIEKKKAELGPMTFREKAITILFTLLVMLWIFRDPHFISGWGNYFPLKLKDATPAIGIPLLLFLIPAEPWSPGHSPPLLDWKTLQNKLPWGIILLLGGGFSLAEGSKQSGLSMWASEQLASMDISSPVVLVSILSLLTAILTEVTSNVATANVLLPVVAQLAIVTKVNPIYYLMPVTIACSFAFMLPVATPPNAIVFDAGRMQTLDMVKPGIFMNIICVAIEILMINTLGHAIFEFGDFPEWAKSLPTNQTLL